MYSPAGRVIGSIIDQDLAPGNYRAALPSTQKSAGIYYIKVISGNGQEIVKFLSVNENRGQNPLINRSRGLKKISATIVDTLVFEKTGYVTKNVPITSYQGALNIAMSVMPTVVDADGNIYHAVTIGTQVWMVENLKTTRYNDGSAIPLDTNGGTWGGLTTGAYCWYNNDSGSNKNTFGALYNWNAVSTGKLAPTGWHVPTDSEWTVLTTFFGGESAAGGALKSTGTTYWLAPNTGATNSSGFSALPGGYRFTNGGFFRIDSTGYWWTATTIDATFLWGRQMNFNNANVYMTSNNHPYGFSVRCLRGAFTLASPVISGIIAVGDSSATVSWAPVTDATSYNLYYKAGTAVDMTSGTKLMGVTSPKKVAGLINGTKYAFAVSSVNAGGESGLSGIVTATPNVVDVDGNIYHAVTIGPHVWMVENLKTTRYNDGSAIPLDTNGGTWGGLTTGAYCWYNNDSASNKNTYGALYNWYAVNAGNLAPAGWHVATDTEWTTLTTFLGGASVAGGALKSTGTTYWQSPNTGATNSSGFSALPGGLRNPNGAFSFIGSGGYWWSATADIGTDAWSNYLYYNTANIGPGGSDEAYGMSLRCVRNN